MNNNTNTLRQPCIGDVYLVKFSGVGSEQQGSRPAVVFQNNVGNRHSPNVIMLPLTSKTKKLGLPTHVFVPSEGTGLARDSVVLCENPECVSKIRLERYITTLPSEYISKIAVANLMASAAISFIDPDILLNAWQKSFALNSL